MTNPEHEELVKLADELIAQNYGNVCDADAMEEHFVLLAKAASALRRLASSDSGMREAFVRALASLAAAISILERTPKAKKAVASDKMFDTMLDDYRKALEIGRAALTTPGPSDYIDDVERSFDETPLADSLKPSDPSSTRSEVTVEGIASVMGCLRVMWSGSDWVIAEDSVSEAARALFDQFEIRRRP